MKMSEVFEMDSFNIRHYCSIVDTSKYAYIEHNEIEIENEDYINCAVENHDRLINLETDRKNAISKMSKSWQHNADDNDDLLTRFVEMANRQFEERDRLREFIEMVADGDNCEESEKLLMAHCFIETAKQLLNGETK